MCRIFPKDVLNKAWLLLRSAVLLTVLILIVTGTARAADDVAVLYVYASDVEEEKVWTQAEMEEHVNGPLREFWKQQSYGRYVPAAKVFVWRMPVTSGELAANKKHYVVDSLKALLPNGGDFDVPEFNPSEYAMTHILLGGNVIGYGGGMGTGDLKVNGELFTGLKLGSYTYAHSTSQYWIPNLRFGYYNAGSVFQGRWNGQVSGYPELGLNDDDGTFLHEWGHGLGLSTHANSWRSEKEPLYGEMYWRGKSDFWSQESDYGNLFDIMGGSPHLSLHINAFYKELLGWIQPDEKVVVSATKRDIQLTPLESSTTSKGRAAQIPVNGKFSRPAPFDSSMDYSFYIEYRRPMGLDKHLNHDYLRSNTEGIMVYMTRRKGADFINSWLLDMSPDNVVYDKSPTPVNPSHANESDDHEVSLNAGKAFYDQQTGWTLNNIRPNGDQGILFDAEQGEKAGVASGVHTIALFSGNSLSPDDVLRSSDLSYYLSLGKDGNIVVRKSIDNSVVWQSQNGSIPVDSSANQLAFNNGNLLLTGGGKTIWSSNTGNNPGARLVVSAKGSPEVQSSMAKVLWPQDTTPGPSNRVADLGFNPERDGFSFPNYGNSPGLVNLTPIEVQRLFGTRVVAATNGANIVLTPPGLKWMQQQNDGMNGGHCEGMAVLSLLIYNKTLDVNKLGAQSTFELKFDANELLQREIGYWFVTQGTQPAQSSVIKGTPVEILDRLIEVLKPGTEETYTIGVYAQPPLRGGHAVTPYAVEDMGSGIFHVLVYDNNHVGIARRLVVDRNKNTWQLNLSTNPLEAEGVWMGDASSLSLEICPGKPRLTLQDCPFCDETSSVGPMGLAAFSAVQRYNEIYIDGNGVQVLITDKQGKRFGYINGRLIQEIPGVSFRRTKSSDDLFKDDSAPVILVPVNIAFNLTLDGSTLTNSTAADVVLIGPGHDVSIEGIMLDPGQKDTIDFAPDGGSVSYKSSGSESPDISIGFEAKGADYSFTVKGVESDPGATVTLTLDRPNGLLILTSQGNSETGVFELFLGRYNDTRAEEFFHDDIQLGTNDTATVEYLKWSGNSGSLPLLIDRNNDGTIDERIALVDEDAPAPGNIPRLMATLGANGKLTISWASTDSRLVLEYTTALNGQWVPVPPAEIITAGGASTYIDSALNGARFYRLRKI